MGVFVNGIAIKGESEFYTLEAEEVEETAKEISLKRRCPVLSVYIYDGDYWGYMLYLSGEIKNEFATMPDYFEDSEEVVFRYTANVPLLSQSFTVSEKQIERYLCHWTDAMLEGEDFAYEDDEFPYSDAWQMVDFLKTLGFRYPEGELPNSMCVQLPTLRKILENNLPANECEELTEDYPLIDMLPSAFSSDYLWNLLEDNRIKEFQFTDKTPPEIIDFVIRYCGKVQQPEKNSVCQHMNVLAAFCAYWMNKGSGWSFLDRATYEPICLNYEKPTDVYLLRARAAVTAFHKRHRAIRDLKRLIELDPDNIELYQAEIRKWERLEEKWYLDRQ
ncbi:MAG: hypothetical protein K2M60_03650 [Lachnospiraceae bacterium]|nr:hypothetical protein [Lachnospiraceae bacterium]MDE6251371.1 hypothetical protein [Lachnospiraceae bacterium]